MTREIRMRWIALIPLVLLVVAMFSQWS